MITEFIILIIAFISTLIGFYYFINNFRKIKNQEVEKTSLNELPHNIKRSFGFILLGFLFLTLLSLFIVI